MQNRAQQLLLEQLLLFKMVSSTSKLPMHYVFSALIIRRGTDVHERDTELSGHTFSSERTVVFIFLSAIFRSWISWIQIISPA